MGELAVHATVVGVSAAEVYRRIAAFPDYTRLCDAVREVEVIDADDRHMTSRWEVKFHRGILRWTEQAEFFPDEGLINFNDLDGDIDEFRGYWRIGSRDGSTHNGIVSIEFSVVYDIGIPTLEHILEPIADEALHENVSSILYGLLGDAVTVVPAETTPTAASTAESP